MPQKKTSNPLQSLRLPRCTKAFSTVTTEYKKTKKSGLFNPRTKVKWSQEACKESFQGLTPIIFAKELWVLFLQDFYHSF